MTATKESTPASASTNRDVDRASDALESSGGVESTIGRAGPAFGEAKALESNGWLQCGRHANASATETGGKVRGPIMGPTLALSAGVATGPLDSFSGVSPLWWITKDGDNQARQFFDRHYSRQFYRDGRNPKLFCGPGEKLVLRTWECDALFVWRKFIDDSGQTGINCAVFRNESSHTSSELIRQADVIADFCWPGERHYTFVDARRIRSTNPGFCFKAAGWQNCGTTKRGLLILERPAISGVSGRADGVPNQRPESRRTEHSWIGASRLTSDRSLNTIDRAERFVAREREYVMGLMLLTLAFGLAVATWLERVTR